MAKARATVEEPIDMNPEGEQGSEDVTSDSPLLPPPSPFERGIIQDWVSYTRVSAQRMANSGSPYAEPLREFAAVMDDVLNPSAS